MSMGFFSHFVFDIFDAALNRCLCCANNRSFRAEMRMHRERLGRKCTENPSDITFVFVGTCLMFSS